MSSVSDPVTGNGKKGSSYAMLNNNYLRGPQMGHLDDLGAVMDDFVEPNGYRGVVLGIGLPERDFPQRDELLGGPSEIGSEYAGMMKRFNQAIDEGWPKLGFFERLYLLENALFEAGTLASGDTDSSPHIDAQAANGLESTRFVAVPYGRTFIVPKFPHRIYPERYDTWYRQPDEPGRFQGQFEPDKSRIAGEYIFDRGEEDAEGRAMTRIKSKGDEEREINVWVGRPYKGSDPGDVRSLRIGNVFSREAHDEMLKEIKDLPKDVCVLPYGMTEEKGLTEDQMNYIEETIGSSIRRGQGKVVIAVPYLSPWDARHIDVGLPQWDAERMKSFWMEERTKGYGLTFDRYAAARRKLDNIFEGDASDLKNVHLTFVEVDKEGMFPDVETSRSFLPPFTNAEFHGPNREYMNWLSDGTKRDGKPGLLTRGIRRMQESMRKPSVAMI